MTPSVAPLDCNIVPYSITINVSPKKILSNRKVYGDLSLEMQKEAIQDVFSFALHSIQKSAEDCEIVFETTKAGNAHLHGLIACTSSEMYQFQRIVASKLGFPRLEPSVCCMCLKTIYSTVFWERYMQKSQRPPDDGDSIPVYNMFVS